MEDIHILSTSAPGEAVVHHLPCKINMDGPAKVSTYFVPEENKDGIPIAYFRGRKLDGTKLSLNQKHQVAGYILREVPVEITPVKPVTTLSRTNNGNDNLGDMHTAKGGSNPASRAAALAALIAEEENEDDDDGYGGMGGGFGFDDEEAEDDMDNGNDEEKNNQQQTYGSRRYTQEDETTNPRSSSSVPTHSSVGHRAWTIDSQFRSIYDWQFDRTSVEADMIPSALEWIELARAIHQNE